MEARRLIAGSFPVSRFRTRPSAKRRESISRSFASILLQILGTELREGALLTSLAFLLPLFAALTLFLVPDNSGSIEHKTSLCNYRKNSDR